MSTSTSEHIGSVKGRTRATQQIEVIASAGPKRRFVTLNGMEGAVEIDASAIDELQALLDLAKKHLSPVKPVKPAKAA